MGLKSRLACATAGRAHATWCSTTLQPRPPHTDRSLSSAPPAPVWLTSNTEMGGSVTAGLRYEPDAPALGER